MKKLVVFLISFLVVSSLSLQISLQQEVQTVDKSVQYVGKLSSYTSVWRSNLYDITESIELVDSGITFTSENKIFDLADTEISSGGLIFNFEFLNTIDLSSASGKGTPEDPEFGFPIENIILNQFFLITGVGNNRISASHGIVRTAINVSGSDFRGGVKYTVYEINVYRAADDVWAEFLIVDLIKGQIVDVVTINKGDVVETQNSDLEIRLIEVFVTNDEFGGEVISAKILISKIGESRRVFTTECDTSSTGSSSTLFPKESVYCIKVSGFSRNGIISPGDKIQVVFKPSVPHDLDDSPIFLPNRVNHVRLLDKKIVLNEGWNQISSPVEEGVPVSLIYDKCDTGAVTYYYDGTQYVTVSELEPRKGYWIRAFSNCEVPVDGTFQEPNSGFNLNRGWNMISGNDLVNELRGNCKINIVWHWNPDIGNWDQIKVLGPLNPSHGYWFFAERDCTFGTPVSGLVSSSIKQDSKDYGSGFDYYDG